MQRLFTFVLNINSPDFTVNFNFEGQVEKIHLNVYPKGYWHSPNRAKIFNLSTAEINSGLGLKEYAQGESLEERLQNTIRWLNRQYELEFGHKFNEVETTLSQFQNTPTPINSVAQNSLNSIRKHLNM